jgi:hypothetical protein
VRAHCFFYYLRVFLFFVSALLVACKQTQPLSAKQVLDSVYRQYDAKLACWIANDNNANRYCMRLDSEKMMHLPSGDRLYVLVAGEMIDEYGESNAGHVDSGLVGAFVANTVNGKTNIIASNPAVQSGAFGRAPSGWHMLQLGANDYWGWQNKWGDVHQGYSGSYFTILAPYGKSIKELAMIGADYDNTGAIDPDACQQAASNDVDNLSENSSENLIENLSAPSCQQPTSISATFKIDRSNPSVRVYPLQLTVTGVESGKTLKPSAWTFTFDTKKWTYREPQDYILSGKDF